MQNPAQPLFMPTFGSGAPGASVPTNNPYLDTSTTPYTLYMYDRANSLWFIPTATGSSGSQVPIYVFPFPDNATLSDAQNFGSRGTVITPSVAVSVYAMWAMFTGVSGGTYKLGIAPFDTGTGKMTSNPTYTASTTLGANGLTNIVLNFASPVSLTAGTVYIFFLVRTDVAGNTSLNMVFSTVAPSSPKFVPQSTTNQAWKTASNNPTTADTWTSGGAIYPTLPIYQ